MGYRGVTRLYHLLTSRLGILYFLSFFRVGHEKLVDGLTRVGPAWIREDAPGSTTGPGMPHSVDFVIANHVAAVDVLPRVHGVGPFSVRPSRVHDGTAGMLKGGGKVPRRG